MLVYLDLVTKFKNIVYFNVFQTLLLRECEFCAFTFPKFQQISLLRFIP